MARRGDNIRKRKDGRWEGRYKKGRNSDGTIVYGSVYGRTYLEVKEKLSYVLVDPAENFQSKNQQVTFGDVLVKWMRNNEVRLKGGTINKYQNIIDTHIMPELGKVKAAEITSTMINEFLAKKLSNGRIDGSGALSSSYVRSIMLVITSALKYAVSENVCPALKTPINKPALEKKDFSVFSLEEQKKFEMLLNEEFNEMNAGILISLHTGLRIGEICALSWNDIDLKCGVIHVRHTVARIKNDDTGVNRKTKLIVDRPKTRASIRDIPISSQLMPILLHLRNCSQSLYVISKGNSFVSPRTLEYHYHRMLDYGNMPSLNFHCIRHTFATRCIEAGVDVKSLSEILGHANVGVTLNTYVHSSIELKRTQLEKLTALSA